MLSADHRLRSKKDFSRIFSKGTMIHTKGMFMRVVRGKTSVPSRFGFVVSTKVAKRAIVRNRLRRRMRAIVSRYLDRIPAGLDAVFVARKECVDMEFDELETTMVRLMAKGRLIAEE